MCLKIGKTPKPNGLADHYPVFKWLFHWEYTQHFQTNPHGIFQWPHHQGRALAVAAVAPCGFAPPRCGAGASPDAHGGERGGETDRLKRPVSGSVKQGCNQ